MISTGLICGLPNNKIDMVHMILFTEYEMKIKSDLFQNAGSI